MMPAFAILGSFTLGIAFGAMLIVWLIYRGIK
jgi:hypothetical protein